MHRDIKSSNVMLSPKEPGGYVAKIIDLGLAKAVEELPKEAALSNAKDPQNRPQDPSEVQVTVERTMQALDHRPLFSGLPLPSVLRGNVVILSIVAGLAAVIAAFLSCLGLVEAFLGDKEDAIRKGREAVEMPPSMEGTCLGSFLRLNLAAIYAWSGETDNAIDVLAGMMGKPVGPRYGELKFNPIWDPIRDHPRFQKLLEDIYPK